MATLSSRPLIQSQLLRLPSSVRASTYQSISARSFSATATRNVNLVDLVVAPPVALLDGLHSVGLPWLFALPSAALLVRGLIGFYLVGKPRQRAAQIQANLVPLSAAILHQELQTAKRRPKITFWTLANKQHDILSRVSRPFGARFSFARPVLNFGLLIAMMEAVRMKTGSREGMLSLVLTPFDWLARQIWPDRFSEEPSTEDKRIERYVQAGVQDEDGNWMIDPTKIPADVGESAYAAYFDPSLQTDLASWGLNLAAPDPTGVLPVLVGVLMAVNVLSRSGSSIPAVQTLFLAFSVYLGYAAFKWPMALLLYFVPNIFIAWVQRRYLITKYPIIKPIQPCARPIRMKVRKTMGT